MADLFYKALVLAMLAVITVCSIKAVTDGTLIEVVVSTPQRGVFMNAPDQNGWEI